MSGCSSIVLKSWRLVIFLALGSSLIFLAACQDKGNASSLTLSDGHSMSEKDWRGKWIFVNYWATWCHNCEGEIAAFNHLWQEPGASKQFLVFGYNYSDLKGGALQKAIDQFHIRFPVVLKNPAGILPVSQEVSAVPVTFVIDPEGRLTQTLWGPQTLASLHHAMQTAL